MKKPKISVVTVVYNDVSNIENTIKSVINQNYENLEYLIIDGGSNDGTMNVVNKYRDRINYIISEKDNGMVDAMNKGILACIGQWVNFMNGGDTFYNDRVLSNVFGGENRYDGKIMIYGDTVIKGGNYWKAQNIAFVKKFGRVNTCHQSMFFNTGFGKTKLLYDTSYLVAGDGELVVRLYKEFGEKKFDYVNLIITNYLGDGNSVKNAHYGAREGFTTLYKHYGLWTMIKGLFHHLIYTILFKDLKIHEKLPKPIYRSLRYIYRLIKKIYRRLFS